MQIWFYVSYYDIGVPVSWGPITIYICRCNMWTSYLVSGWSSVQLCFQLFSSDLIWYWPSLPVTATLPRDCANLLFFLNIRLQGNLKLYQSPSLYHEKLRCFEIYPLLIFNCLIFLCPFLMTHNIELLLLLPIKSNWRFKLERNTEHPNSWNRPSTFS